MRERGIRPGVREDTPERHRVEKAGTPTFGGIAILFGALLGVSLSGSLDPRGMEIILCALPFALLGAADDFLKARQKRKVVGLKARYKLLAQALFGALVSLYIVSQLGTAPPGAVRIPFDGAILLPLWGKVALDTVVFVGATNAVNLTDGLDGLAAGLVAICCFPLLVLAPHGPTVALVSLLGACLGFLWFNSHPASIFMGDTGSLFLGAMLAGFSCAVGLEFFLALSGLVFVAEAGSVILQVVYFKATKGGRIFRMAPLHHHFELQGWPEPKVVFCFWIAGVAAAGMAVLAGGG